MNALTAATPVSLNDRRRQPRRYGVEMHGVHRARLRPGIDVDLLDLSVDGAAIETAYRLMPGRQLILQLSFATGVISIRTSVLWAIVNQLSGECVAYRGGLKFERRLWWTDEPTGAIGALVV